MVLLSVLRYRCCANPIRVNLEVQEIVLRAFAAPKRHRLCSCCTVPAAGDKLPAIGASAIPQTIFFYVVPRTADQNALTLRTRSVRAVRKNIALVNEMQSDFAGDGARAMQSFGRRARLILQLEIGMKGSEVQWNVGPQMLEN